MGRAPPEVEEGLRVEGEGPRKGAGLIVKQGSWKMNC